MHDELGMGVVLEFLLRAGESLLHLAVLSKNRLILLLGARFSMFDVCCSADSASRICILVGVLAFRAHRVLVNHGDLEGCIYNLQGFSADSQDRPIQDRFKKQRVPMVSQDTDAQHISCVYRSITASAKHHQRCAPSRLTPKSFPPRCAPH
jgi:hypothetical protein